MADLSGIASASAVLRDLFLMVQKDWTKGELRRPDNIVEIQVCSLSGKNPNENCSTLREELFLQGTEPGDHCTYHRIIDGRLTTVYPELYRKWARKNRLQNRVEIETGKKKGIIFPQRGDFFHISDDIPLSGQQIQFRTIGFQKDIMIGYILNDEMLIRLPFPSFPSWQLERGDFKLKIAVNGRIVDEVSFIVR